MVEPVFWNTADEAAAWLTKETRRPWSIKEVLSAALDSHEKRMRDPKNHQIRFILSRTGRKLTMRDPRNTCLEAAMPSGTQFGNYETRPEEVTAENPRGLVKTYPGVWQTIPMEPWQVRQLIMTGETWVEIAKQIQSVDGKKTRYILVEPLDQRHVIQIHMIGINAYELESLASEYAGVKVEKKLTGSQTDKQDCQEIAKELWKKYPNASQVEIINSPELAAYKREYKGKNTLPGWLREIDPRAPETRRGRPSKNARPPEK